jgi:ribosomal subunit interface protein
MQLPIQITFRHMEPSDAVRARVLDLMQRLERFHGRITRCQVVVDAPAKHQRHGAPFSVKIDIQIPGEALHVHSQQLARETHADVYVALTDAFDSLKRKLQQATGRVAN